jgi:DNA sulfur modification protein DndD
VILTGLRIRNFRQYKGAHQIAFSEPPGRSTTIVTGQNGAGKTNLFLALNWCLYGLGMEDKGVIISKGLPPEEQGDGGFVEVHFRHDGFRYIARRDVEPRGSDLEVASDLELSELGVDGRAKKVQNPNQKINTILPADARQYFFFDGERIDEMSRPGHEEQVREAIRSVLKLKALERAVEHLNSVEADYARVVRKTADASNEVQQLVEASEEIKARIGEMRDKRVDKDEERASAQRQLNELNSRLRTLDEVKAVVVEQRENARALKTAQSRHLELIESAGELVARGGPSIVLTRIRQAASTLDDKRKKGEIPSNVRETLIDDLLKAKVCICERHLDEAATTALLRRKEGTVPDAAEETILTAAGAIASLERVGTDVPERLIAIMRTLVEVKEEMEDRHRRDDELREKLKDEFSDDIAALETSRRDAENRVRDLTHEVARLEANIEVAEQQQEDLKRQRERIEVQSESVRRDLRRYELARSAADAAEHLLKNFAEEMRKRIEAETDRIFKEMIWKEDHFDSANILEDYRLDVIDRYGASALKELSAGERQLLSLAFILAMAKVTGEEATLVIDTPFGRISEEPLHNVARTLPELAGQLVLLVTDRELDAEAAELIRPHVGKEYELSFDEVTGTTHIVEVSHERIN